MNGGRGCNDGENERGKVCVQGEVTGSGRRCRKWQGGTGAAALVLWFFKREGVAAFCRDGFRFRFSFLVFPPGLSKLPFLVCVGLVVFIGEVWLGRQTWSLNFSFLFANLIFLVFCIFFKNEQYQYQLNEESQ
jgi:hypothetical protein